MLLRIGNKIPALIDDSLRRVRGHKTIGSSFFPFIVADLGKIAGQVGQQFQIIRNILFALEGVFCQQDRNLGL